MLGTTFWQSMKNKMRKAKKSSGDSMSMEDTKASRVWDLRILFEQEPRMWAACFRTPESFVVLANCVTSRRGVVPIDTQVLDLQVHGFRTKPPKLPNLGAAGRVVLRSNRLYISAMDLCRYYWKDKGIGTYDRQMQSWNAGRRAALREKAKSFVYIEECLGVETEWWDVEGILTSTKVLRKFLVEAEGAEPLSQLARYVYQCRDFYGDAPSGTNSPSRGLFAAEDSSTSSSKRSGSTPEPVGVRKRTPSMKAEGTKITLSTTGLNVSPTKRRKSSMGSTPSPPPPTSPIAMRNTLSNVSSQSIGSPLYAISPRSPRSPDHNFSQNSRWSPSGTPFQQMIREHIGSPKFNFHQPFDAGGDGASNSAVGLMLLVDAATRNGKETEEEVKKLQQQPQIPPPPHAMVIGSPIDTRRMTVGGHAPVQSSQRSAFSAVEFGQPPPIFNIYR